MVSQDSLDFKVWTPYVELGYDVADHSIKISIKGLPFHMWKNDAEEMYPYCAVSLLHMRQ